MPVVAFTCSALAIAVCGGSSAGARVSAGREQVPVRAGAAATSTSPLSFGLFAGYVRVGHGRVTSMRASWTVPRVLGGPRHSQAGTWIGAQGQTCPVTSITPALPTATRASSTSTQDLFRVPFIQVGTIEGRYVPWNPFGVRSGYFAFWSDTNVRFAAQLLFPVKPGDEVSARLVLARGRWTVSLLDVTSGAWAETKTTDEARAVLDVADWLQEDPVADLRTLRPGPYPDLSTVRMHDIQVNSSTPLAVDVTSSWMDRGTAYLAPGPLSNGAFSLGPATLTPAGRRYLGIAYAENVAMLRFVEQLAAWTPATRISRVAAESAALAGALHKSIDALASAPWPSESQAPIDTLVAQTRALEVQTRQAAAGSGAGLAAWKSAWLNDARAAHDTSLTVRRMLHLPDHTATCRR